MGVHFDWQAGDDSGAWETLAETRRRRWLRWVPRWAWYVVLAVFVGAAGGGYVALRHRYQQVQKQITFQLQDVIDLEARAYAERDADLFMAQQDVESPDWYDLQKWRIRAFCPRAYAPTSPGCTPVLPAKVQDVDLRAGVAWVEVIEDDPPVRRARFYRQTDLGWKHTAPRVEFWGRAIELHYGDVILRYHKRDQPYVDALSEHIVESFYAACDQVGCAPDQSLEVNFDVDEFLPIAALPPLEGTTWLLPSPWLSGLPVEDADDALSPQLAALSAQIARGMALQAMGEADEARLSDLQEVVLDEYVAWHVEGDTSRAPILGYLIDLRGDEVLPGIFQWFSERRIHSLDALLGRWLTLSPTGAGPVHFAAQLNIERAALRAGHKDTFLMLQDGEDEVWALQQEAFYDEVQRYDEPPSALLFPAEVAAVDLDGDRALVRLRDPLPRIQGQAPQSLGRYAFFVRRDGEWKRASTGHALYWDIPLSEARLSRPLPLPAPDQGTATLRFITTQPSPQVDAWVAAFASVHPGIQVEVIPAERSVSLPFISDDLVEDLPRMFWVIAYQMAAAGDVVAWLPYFDVPPPGIILDLAPFVEADDSFDRNDFYPSMLAAWQWGGGTWALPSGGFPYLIFYDKAAFDEAGEPYPRPGWTQADFERAARQLTHHKGDEVQRYGFVDLSDWPIARTFVEGRAGPLAGTSASHTECALTEPRTVQAVEWYASLVEDGVMPNPRNSGTTESEAPTPGQFARLVQEGRAAMWTDGAYSLDMALEDPDVGVAPYPTAQYPANPWFAWAHAISSRTFYPEESWLWLRYVAEQDDAGDPFGESEYTVPARRSLAEARASLSQWDDETAQAIEGAMAHARPLRWDACTFALHSALEEIWSGVPVAEALDNAQEQFQGTTTGH